MLLTRTWHAGFSKKVAERTSTWDCRQGWQKPWLQAVSRRRACSWKRAVQPRHRLASSEELSADVVLRSGVCRLTTWRQVSGGGMARRAEEEGLAFVHSRQGLRLLAASCS